MSAFLKIISIVLFSFSILYLVIIVQAGLLIPIGCKPLKV
nr:MAG TPA: hypothetical protein [Caudoviricetes sp.]